MRHAFSWALVLSAVYFVVVFATAEPVGFTRDEGYYFKAAEQYSDWWRVLFSSRFFEAFSDDEIRRYFEYNREHPPLVKWTQGLTYRLFSDWTGLVSPSQGFRIAGFWFAALSMLGTFLLGRALFGARVGLLSAVLFTTLPRYFFDAHLACFDVAITAMWSLSIWAFVRALRAEPARRLRHALVAAVVFGLSLSTKLNALFLPFVFVLLWLVDPMTPLRLTRISGPSGGADVRLPRIPVVLVACALIGPLVLFVTWPWLWPSPISRVGGYLGFHLNHEHYPTSYFGELLIQPPFPWGFPLWMTILTVPLPILAAGAIGLAVSVFRWARARSLADATMVVGFVLPVLLIALPNTPIFGGVKHWYNAMPALCILAGRSVGWGIDLIGERLRDRPPALVRALVVVFVLLSVLPGLLGIIRSHPNGIGYYNELAGGFRGGAELGMQRGFWGGLAAPLYPGLSERLEGPARIFFNRTNYDAYRMYRREGTIDRGLSYANEPKGARMGVHFEQPEHAEKEGEIWSVMGTRPVDGVYQHNVTLIQLYQAEVSRRPPDLPAD